MASIVRELGHGELRCDPSVLYLEIELEPRSSIDLLLSQAREIISRRLAKLGATDTDKATPDA